MITDRLTYTMTVKLHLLWYQPNEIQSTNSQYVHFGTKKAQRTAPLWAVLMRHVPIVRPNVDPQVEPAR